jgi:hypothetical protein
VSRDRRKRKHVTDQAYEVQQYIINKPVFTKELSYAVKLWLKHCATSRKVAALILDGNIAIFH